MNASRECPDCGDELSEIETPLEVFRLRVPFTRVEIVVTAWVDELWCGWCAAQSERDDEAALIEAVAEDAERIGYEQALRDLERGVI